MNRVITIATPLSIPTFVLKYFENDIISIWGASISMG